jgi:hypothetical protein
MNKILILLIAINIPFVSIAQEDIEKLYGEWNYYRIVDACGQDSEVVLESTLTITPFLDDSVRITLSTDTFADVEYNVQLESTTNENIWRFDDFYQDMCPGDITLIENDSLTIRNSCLCLACHCGGEYYYTRVSNPSPCTNTATDEWQIYPNPVEDNLTISRLYSENSASRIHIYDEAGKSIELLMVKSECTTIDFINLPSGVYYVEIMDSEGYLIEKIVKN